MMTSIMCTRLEEKLKEIRSHLLVKERKRKRNVLIESLCKADKARRKYLFVLASFLLLGDQDYDFKDLR